MSATAISLRGLSKSFAGHLSLTKRTVIHDLSFDVTQGEIFGFLGANGAGKTTTIKMIVGLIFPDRGAIEVLGHPHTSLKARERLGFLPENPYFYDYLTAREFLRYYGKLYGLGGGALQDASERVLERVGLGASGDVALRKFSKGMLQRIGIAQAILNRPSVVVFDEPMSGLDPIGRRDVRDLMLELRESGTTVFFSSHILQDAELICDRVAIVGDGQLMSVGPIADLLRSGATGYEILVNGLDGAGIEQIRGASAVRSDKAGGLLLRAGSREEKDRLLQAILARGGTVEQIQPLRQTLEEVFLRTAGSPKR